MTLTQSQLMHLKKLSKGLLKMDFYETQIKAMLIILKGDETPTIEKLSYLYKNGFINDSCLCYYFISELYPNTSPEEFEVVLQNSIRNLGLKDFLVKNYDHAQSLFLKELDKKGPIASRLERTIKACFTICAYDYGVHNFRITNKFHKTLINLNSLENHLPLNLEMNENDIAGLEWVGDLVFKSIVQFADNKIDKLNLSYFSSETHVTYFPDISLDLLDNYARLRELSSINSSDQPSILICSSEDNLENYGSPNWSSNTINFIGRHCFVKNLNTVNGYPRILICFYGISYKNLFKGLSTCFSDTTFNVSNVGEGILFNFNTS